MSESNQEVPPVPPGLTPPLLPVKPRVWPVFVVYGSALVAAGVVSAIVLAVISLVQHGWTLQANDILAANQTLPGLLGSLVATLFVLASAAMGGALLSPLPWRTRLRLHAVPVGIVNLVIGCAGTVGIALILKALDGLGLVPQSPVLDMLEKAMKGLSGVRLVGAVIVIGMMPGVAEELLFRGYIQTRLSQRWGATRAVIWTALLFGVMHMDLVQGSFAFVLGAFLGFVTERCGSIVPAMIFHAANNTLATLLTARNVDFAGHRASVIALVVGVGVVGGAVLYLRRNLPAPLSTSRILWS